MDRSTTPRPALAERGQHSDLLPRRPVSMAMLRKNRSRSGSEELQQITAQHPKNTSGDHPSRPESVTPTPNVYYRSNMNGTHQTLNESAGLLGWMRSTFMSGPSGRNLDVHFEGHDDENPVASIVDRKLNATPLLPGILPLFHRGEHHEDAPLAEGVVIDSARSSFEGLTSEGHDSLETYSYSFDKRRTSQVSNATTVYDDEKDISDQSDVDHAYTPYSNPNATNSTPLVRPTARREALGFASADEVRGNKASSQSGPSYTDRESLSMSEAQSSKQFIEDSFDERNTARVGRHFSQISSNQSIPQQEFPASHPYNQMIEGRNNLHSSNSDELEPIQAKGLELKHDTHPSESVWRSNETQQQEQSIDKSNSHSPSEPDNVTTSTNDAIGKNPIEEPLGAAPRASQVEDAKQSPKIGLSRPSTSNSTLSLSSRKKAGLSQPRRSFGVFSRHRNISTSSPDSAFSDKRIAGTQSSQSPSFWSFKKKSTLQTQKNGDDMNSLHAVGTSPSNASLLAAVSEPNRAACGVSLHKVQSCNGEKKVKNVKKRGALLSDLRPRAVKVHARHKPPKYRDFTNLYLAQELDLHGKQLQSSTDNQSDTKGSYKRMATRVMRFSLDGRYLAVGGQDGVIRIFTVLDSASARNEFLKDSQSSGESSPTSELESDTKVMDVSESTQDTKAAHPKVPSTVLPVFSPTPVQEFHGHLGDVLDLSWSKGGFLLSSSTDKTARIWHLSHPNSLVSFVHSDLVTSAVFHPHDDRFFLSGSLDGKVRLWNISAKKVQYCQEAPGLITACSFTTSGETACVGLFSGAALFYATEGLNLISSVAVRTSKSPKDGRKVTAIEPILPNAKSSMSERVLITSNDSYVRVYDIASKDIIARFRSKTFSNRESQIRATLSDDNMYVVAGGEAGTGGTSDGGQVHIWECGSLLFENSVSRGLLAKLTPNSNRNDDSSQKAELNENVVEYFTAHAHSVTCAVMAPLKTNSILRQAHDPLIKGTDAKLSEKLASVKLNGMSSTASNFTKSLVAAVPTPLRLSDSNTNLKNANNMSATDDVFSLCNTLTRILVSVDDNAIIRVWRNDGLQTLRH